jgi:opacity protein-like surface antigen
MAVAAMLAAAATAHAGSGGVGTTGGGTKGYNSVSSSRYGKIWNGFNAADQHWAHRVGECESGNNPRAIGGGGTYRGAFMFTRDAWKIPRKSPGGDPIRYTWKTQAVVAVLLKHKMGTKPWPVCG